MHLQRVDPDRPREIGRAEAFLHKNGLRLEPLDTAFGVFTPGGEMIGFGGRAGDVLKCFALEEARRGEGLTDALITELITDAFREGIEDLLVYTKADYRAVFLNYDFREVAHTAAVSLLQRGAGTPEEAMNALGIPPEPDAQNGAVVMNANPFTRGHLALAEYAAARSERLYLFVVEHDASFFPFADRFRLVKEGVAHLSNVAVLPSTRYIVSAGTFPSYFLKETEVGEVEHARLDAEIFRRWFVPRFSVRTRYLGEEPADPTTENYNTALQAVLPPACRVEVIPRLRLGDEVISASTVRTLLRDRRWDEIRRRVPESTYRYLRERHD